MYVYIYIYGRLISSLEDSPEQDINFAQPSTRAHIARAFPNGIQWRLSKEPCHGRVVHVAIAPVALHGFIGHQRCTLANLAPKSSKYCNG